MSKFYMTFEDARLLAMKGIKITHEYFTDDEWLIMKGNLIIFEDGVEIYATEWLEGRPYLQVGWARFEE